MTLAADITEYATRRMSVEMRRVARGVRYVACLRYDDWEAEMQLPDQYGESNADDQEAMREGAARALGEHLAAEIEAERPKLTVVGGGADA